MSFRPAWKRALGYNCSPIKHPLLLGKASSPLPAVVETAFGVSGSAASQVGFRFEYF
jgi:hypothetical protein